MLTQLVNLHRRLVLQGPNNPLEKLLRVVLVPFALVYGAVSWVHSGCYLSGFLPRYRSSVPVVSVGNLAAGGTGKTPVVDFLLKHFISQGHKPAVISRGYGGSFSGAAGVVSAGEGLLMTAVEAGDEPVLLARRNPTAKVVVARKRVAGIALATKNLGADLIILDDGFQHFAVARDLDLVLLDGDRPLGNGLPLPAGLLREFPSALTRADLILLTRSDRPEPAEIYNKPVFSCQHQLAGEAVSQEDVPLGLDKFKTKRLFAFAGIADPENFFSALARAGLTLQGQLSLSDHVVYDEATIAQITAAAAGCDCLLTTEKDAVKLTAGIFSLPCYRIPMDIDLINQEQFLKRVKQFLGS